jgi:hypothetical protein
MHVFGDEADPGGHSLVFGENAREGGVCYDAWGGLAENVVGHCVPEKTLEIYLVETDFL